MKFSAKAITTGAIAAVSMLALSACGGGGSNNGSGSGDGKGADTPYTVSANPDVSGSPTYDKIKSGSKITIGVKEDQPGMGYLDPTTGERSGFDVEIAQWMAGSLGVKKDDINYKAIPSSQREQAISNGDVDLYVGTYSINDNRKNSVDFAGPYFTTGQGLLVKKDNTSIKSKDDLGGKNVCSVTGSTPIQKIKTDFPDTKTTEFDVYSKCVDALKNGQVDAVTTDQAILLGYAAEAPDALKVVEGATFSTEKYGVGLKKGDTALRTYLNKTLTDGKDVWQKIYDDTLGKSGTKAEQPAVENY